MSPKIEFDSYPIGRLHQELVKLWESERGFLSVLRNKIPADKKLKDFIRDRDIVCLMDLFTSGPTVAGF